MPWLNIQAGLGGACALEPPWAPASSSPVAAAPSPPVTQGQRRRRRQRWRGRRQGATSASVEPAGAPTLFQSGLGLLNVLSCWTGKIGLCPLAAASELFPPCIGSGVWKKARSGPQAHPLPLGQRTPEPGVPASTSAYGNPRFPHFPPCSFRAVQSIGSFFQLSSLMISPADCICRLAWCGGEWRGGEKGKRKEKKKKNFF